MPQSDVVVGQVDLRADMRSYYRGSVVTHDGQPCLVHEFEENGKHLKAYILKLKANNEWSDPKVVLASSLDFNIPTLGYVFLGNAWHHLSRVPARRMRKGYNSESIKIQSTNNVDCGPFHASHPDIIRQIWFGNTDRLNHDAVIWMKRLWFQGDVVGTISDTGKIKLTVGKEKIGEYVCKLLAANWAYHSSKHSLLPLDL